MKNDKAKEKEPKKLKKKKPKVGDKKKPLREKMYK